jgi:TPR repeat protein
MPNEPSTPPRETEETTADAKTPGSETPEAKEAPEKTENAESPALPAVPKIVPTRTAALSKPRPLKPSPAMASAQNPAKESLFLEGQKYLYGSGGISSNCALAQQYLTASANNNNPKAQSTLGTMYATGHCAQHDLPVAYRWFARALREDPRNTRLSKDVEIMWNQMTAQERTLALKNK